jgi:ABC-type glycerol-3-phosphate transport system substrate-binding protein
MNFKSALVGVGALAMMFVSNAYAAEITVATVNNADMIVMQKLAPKWEKATGKKINWVVLE